MRYECHKCGKDISMDVMFLGMAEVESESIKKPEIMKHYIYSYTWLHTPSMKRRVGAGVSSHSRGMVGLYEYVLSQKEDWSLTHVAEISEEDYDRAQRGGRIG
tara:strand:- start:107 stop:415 length:309 start_codon:yes stop_codon:yes gene_type:complete